MKLDAGLEKRREATAMLVSDLLRHKGSEVITIAADAGAREAMGKLVEHKIGALVVVDGEGFPCGIISERDFLRESYEKGNDLGNHRVRDLMTANIVVGLPTDDLDYLMAVMTGNRIRHVPIVEGKKLVGIVSIGDAVKALLKETQATNRYLEEYVSGKYTS